MVPARLRPLPLLALALIVALGGLAPLPLAAPVPPARAEPLPAAAPSTPTMLDPALQRLVQNVLRQAPGRYSVVVESLVDGRQARVNADHPIEPASVYKLFVMYEVFRQIHAGRFTLDTTLVVSDRAAGQNMGLPVPPAGTVITVREAVERMIQVSDNTCAVLLGDYVGWSRMRDSLRAIDIDDTEFWPELSTTAEDVARLLALIGTDQAVDRESSEAMLDILLGQQWNDRLPKGLPANARIGHKTGELDGYVHDAGIVVAPFGRYVIVVLSEGGSRGAFVELARLVHAYLTSISADVF